MKNVLITGGSRGIGAACARALARDGYRVLINFRRSREAAERLAAELGGVALQADVGDPEQVQRMLDQAGTVDALVANAGISGGERLFQETDPAFWRELFRVNVDGVYNVCRGVVPSMIHRKQGGIVTISSVWGQIGGSCEVAYSATKGAVLAFTKALAKELGPSGIRVNAVAPGVIETDMLREISQEGQLLCALDTPLCRNGQPEEVAEAVAFLLSDRAGFITGQVLGVNGGFFTP